MTLNDLERRNSLILRFFHGIRQILRPIISQCMVKILSPSSNLLLLGKT